MTNFSKIIRISLLSIISAIIFFGCKKDNDDRIPDTMIYIDPIYINDAEYQDLFLIPYGTHIFENVGYKGNGVVVINLGDDKFAAYDCTCTHEVKAGCYVRNDEDNTIGVKCSCCGSTYELLNGTVTQSPAEFPLKSYNTAFNGEYLRIYN